MLPVLCSEILLRQEIEQPSFLPKQAEGPRASHHRKMWVCIKATGELIEINLDRDRPYSFDSKDAELQWERSSAINAIMFCRRVGAGQRLSIFFDTTFLEPAFLQLNFFFVLLAVRPKSAKKDTSFFLLQLAGICTCRGMAYRHSNRTFCSAHIFF